LGWKKKGRRKPKGMRMPKRKANKTANVCANIYDGEFQATTFDCVGVLVCRFALCSLMPPDGSEECVYSEHSSCVCPQARYVALKSLRDKLSKELKSIEDILEG